VIARAVGPVLRQRGGVTESLVSEVDGQLRRDDRGATGPIIDHLEQVGGLVVGERAQQCVVENQDVDARERRHHPREAPVGTSNAEIVEQSWGAHVEGPVTVANGVLG
jgi:hypothetical protein